MKKLIKKFSLVILIALLVSCTSNVEDTYVNNIGDKSASSSYDGTPLEITENLIVITVDGLRWQEIFGVEDVFDRNYLTTVGDLYGDRNQGNLVNVANSTQISYPGYHELFTGNTSVIINNAPTLNPHETVFEFINEQSGFENKDVQVVGLWTRMREVFRVALPSSIFPVLTPAQLDTENRVIDIMPYLLSTADIDIYTEAFEEVKTEALSMASSLNSPAGDIEGELLLYLIGKKSLEKINPRVMYMQFSATDSEAHAGRWDGYINSAKNNGIFIKNLVNFVNTHPNYAGKTTILITTDHGRGTTNWVAHGGNISGSDQTWFVMINPTTITNGGGIVNSPKQYFTKEMSQTMANILGLTYVADHEIAEPLDL